MFKKRNKKQKIAIPASVITLGFVSFFTDAASEMLYPLVPIFVSLLGSGAVAIGIIEGLAETTASILKLYGGVISDKTGRRKIFILIGYSISSFVRPFTGLASSAWQIVYIRMIDRVGKGIRTAPRDALIASAADQTIRGKAYGFHRAMDHAGAAAGPFLAILSLIIIYNIFNNINPLEALRITFLTAIIPGIFAVLLIIIFVKEPWLNNNKNPKQKFTIKSFDKNFLSYLAIVSLFTLGNSTDAFLLLRVADTLEQSGTLTKITDNLPFLNEILNRFNDLEIKKSIMAIFALPVFWAFFHVLKSVLSTPLSGLSDKIGRKRTISVGWFIYAVTYSGFAFIDYVSESSRVYIYIGLFAIYAFYYAFTEGTEKALIADIVPERVRGSAFGAYNFAVGIIALPASVIFGIIYAYAGAMIAFLSGAMIAVLSIFCLISFVKEKELKN